MIDWTKIEQDSLARRTEKVSGGFVVRRERRYHGCYNTAPMSMAPVSAYYERLWKRLTKRLRYGGNKARNAWCRIARCWGQAGVKEAEVETGARAPSKLA